MSSALGITAAPLYMHNPKSEPNATTPTDCTLPPYTLICTPPPVCVREGLTSKRRNCCSIRLRSSTSLRVLPNPRSASLCARCFCSRATCHRSPPLAGRHCWCVVSAPCRSSQSMHRTRVALWATCQHTPTTYTKHKVNHCNKCCCRSSHYRGVHRHGSSHDAHVQCLDGGNQSQTCA